MVGIYLDLIFFPLKNEQPDGGGTIEARDAQQKSIALLAVHMTEQGHSCSSHRIPADTHSHSGFIGTTPYNSFGGSRTLYGGKLLTHLRKSQ